MQLYKVVFHFDNENTKTLHVYGNDEQDVLKTIYVQKDYFEGTNKSSRGYHRINLNQVTYVSVYDQ
ncbi:hypothetical protein AF332_20405 [Sporosarcina globispora]|uniref:Uncharacterized protein n=1 Tax=Sporosarcina globispora TaxID=1459 RepID=A0A0M0GHK2_SPOGL|nr:hypothetical protein [Sporosarcina globispora]KON88921.1 hypothetical protein AF332_20405 [Sporosarcina globispora]